jgi:hypothetical protein
MLLTNLAALLLMAAIFPHLLLGQSTSTGPNREHFQNTQVLYGWAQDGHGERLRTFITRPNNATGKVPAIFFVGWLSCDTVEYPDADTHDGFGILLRRLIEQSGYATARMDKPGVGESQGDCGKADFTTELSGYQSAFDEMLKYDFIDPANIFVVGLSGPSSPPASGARVRCREFLGAHLVRTHAGSGAPSPDGRWNPAGRGQHRSQGIC